MKSELTSLDLLYLVRELQELIGVRVDKVYEKETDKKDFLFTFRKMGEGKQFLRVKLPSAVYLSEFKGAYPESPPGFCTFLRKHLGSSKVLEVRQKGFERILEIVFEVKEGKRILVCELFSTGNMLLLDEELKIKGLLETQNWESRTIRGGTKYQYPPLQPETPKMTMFDFEKIVTGTAFDAVVKCFAIELGLGGFYAEELCKRAGINKDKKRLSYDELQKAYTSMHSMLHSSVNANHAGGEILPIETSLTPDKHFESFSQALDSVMTEKLEEASGAKEAKEKKTKEKKIRVVIEKQEERLRQLEADIVENHRKGELIYEHYTDVKELLDNINSDRKKMSWDDLKKKYPGVEIDEKKGKVTVELK